MGDEKNLYEKEAHFNVVSNLTKISIKTIKFFDLVVWVLGLFNYGLFKHA
jgi:hypothetical protein